MLPLAVINDLPRVVKDRDSFADRGYVTNASSLGKYRSMPRKSVALLCDRREIWGIALLERGQAVTTFQQRMKFSRIVGDFSIEASRLTRAMPKGPREHARRRLKEGGIIPPKTADALLETMNRLAPELAFEISLLAGSGIIPGWLQDRESRSYETVALEREAVAAALRATGLSAQALSEWDPPDGPAPFLQGLRSAVLREDHIISNDLHYFGGWRREDILSNIISYEKDGHRVTVANFNREPPERVLGVDLLYYNHKFEAYTLVQYKRLRRERPNSEPVYRPDQDEDLKREIERMNRLVEPGKTHTLREYRLHQGGAFLKTCSPHLPLYSSRLAAGMYFPLDMWDLTCKSREAKGPRGGTAISFQQVRYLRNDAFIGLVQDGWIGTRSLTSNMVSELISDAIRGRRSVIAATSTPPMRFPQHKRRRGPEPPEGDLYDYSPRESPSGDS